MVGSGTFSTQGDSGSMRAAVVVAHPVHLFRLYGWIEENKPVIYSLTNSEGTGPLGPSHTTDLMRQLERLGATVGEVFDTSDADIYRAVLGGDAALFIGMMTRIAASLVRHDVGLVVADAHEGCSVAHDLCRAVTDGAVALAAAELTHDIANYGCHQTEWWDPPPPHDGSCRHLVLDDATFRRKLAAAAQYPEWNGVIQEAIDHLGTDHFRTECLRAVPDSRLPIYPSKPFYETSGERQVAQGRFATVIRYAEHVRPIWSALHARAGLG